MNFLSESLAVLSSQPQAVLLVALAAGLGALLFFGLLRRITGNLLPAPQALAFSLAGWPLVWVLSAWLALWLNHIFHAGVSLAPFLLVVFGLVIVNFWKRMEASPWGGFSWQIIFLALAALLSLFTRLAFLADLEAPLYFDGALHYDITRSLLADFGTFPWLAGGTALLKTYYHIGFHLLTAVFSSLLNLNLMQALLLTGQFLVAALPFPVFGLVLQETGSARAAFLAFILAGWGWFMPAYALNWGKYPALAGLLALQVALALGWLTLRLPLTARAKLLLIIFTLLSVLAAALMHTRALVVLFIVALSYGSANLRLGRVGKVIAVTFVVLALGLTGAYLYSREILRPVLAPYLNLTSGGLWVTLGVAALMPFAFRRSGRLAFTSLLTLLLLLTSLLIPSGLASFPTLLDRPFVEMALYLPLAGLGGLGFAGMLQMFERRRRFWALLTVLLFGALLANIGVFYRFSPLPCCALFGRDDAVALDWMKNTLPKDALVLVAGNTLNVYDTLQSDAMRNTDAGVWVSPLTGNPMLVRPFTTDFSQPEVHASLCGQAVRYIYVGGSGESFNPDGLTAHPQWYARALFLPGASVYALLGCT